MPKLFRSRQHFALSALVVVAILLVFARYSVAVAVFRVDPVPVMITSGNPPVGGNPALYAVAGAAISLCTDSACTVPATAYTDSTGNTACPINASVTLPG